MTPPAVGRVGARTRRDGPRFDEVATVVHRLSVLLGAGIAPLSAWRHVGRAGGGPADGGREVAAEVAARATSAHEVGATILAARSRGVPGESEAWAALAAAWTVASQVGAPLAPTLARLAEVLRGLAQSARDVEVALAGPVATSRIVLTLPAIGLGFSLLLGLDALRVLLGTAPGLVCLALAVALLVGGIRWNRRLVRAAVDLDPTPGLALELVAVAVSGGTSAERALALAEQTLTDAGLPPPGEAANEVLAFCRAAGVPAATMLRAEAEEARRAARSTAQQRAARLGTALLLPLGVCVLPAFMLVGVAPMLLAILSSTVGTG